MKEFEKCQRKREKARERKTLSWSLTVPIENKTRVQMPTKIFPHLKVKCLLFMGPALGFDTKQRNSFSTKFGVFLQLKQESDNYE
jgi:hypothetical protein